MTVIERIEQWYGFAIISGRDIDLIPIHPSDAVKAPVEFNGIPVVALGSIEAHRKAAK